MLLDALHVRRHGNRDCSELLEPSTRKGDTHPAATRFGLGEGRTERAREAKLVSWVRIAEGVEEEALSAALAWAGVKAVAMERLLLTVIEEGELPKVQAQKRSRTDASRCRSGWAWHLGSRRTGARPTSRPGTARCPSCRAPKPRPTTTSMQAWWPEARVASWGDRFGQDGSVHHLIAEALSSGQQVLFLVPEIALTTQLIERLRRFGDVVHVYHSRFSDRERTETWMSVLQPALHSSCGCALGGPLPLPKLGLIVVDEEHEPSFKQHDPAPRYHARDVALWMASRQDALVLGSATAVETQWLGEQGLLQVVPLTERFGGALLLKFSWRICAKNTSNEACAGFSKMLRDEMDATLKEGRQVILFQNRRGYAPAYQCTQCGHAATCERCDIHLWCTKRWEACIAITAGTTNVQHRELHFMRKHGAETARPWYGAHRGRTGRVVPHREGGKNGWTPPERKGTREAARGLANVNTTSWWAPKWFPRVGLCPCWVGRCHVGRPHAHVPRFQVVRARVSNADASGRSRGAFGRRGEGKVVIQTFSADHWLLHHVVDHNHEALVRRVDRASDVCLPTVRPHDSVDAQA